MCKVLWCYRFQIHADLLYAKKQHFAYCVFIARTRMWSMWMAGKTTALFRAVHFLAFRWFVLVCHLNDYNNQTSIKHGHHLLRGVCCKVAGLGACSGLVRSYFQDTESRTGCDRLMVLEWNRSERMVQLLDERDLGVLTAVMSLLVALVANSPEAYWNCVPKCVRTLERLTRSQDIPQEYTYYGIPSPWLQVCSSFKVVPDAISFWIH